MDLTHFDENGNARMVDVTEKADTERIAVARGSITMSEEAFLAVKNKTAAKGDVLTVATTAGIMGAKRTSEFIPMCHILSLTGVSVTWELDDAGHRIFCEATVKTTGKTGVEMEALTAASTALLTVYDMVKAIDRTMVISDIMLIEKDGGKSGHFVR